MVDAVLQALNGKTILIVEDEYLVGVDLRSMLETAGAIVIGPINDVTAASAMASDRKIDGAVLDVRVKTETSERVAEHLVRRRIPFMVVSGYSREGLPPCGRGPISRSR